MEELLSACEATCEFLFNKDSKEPVTQRLRNDKILRDYAWKIQCHLNSYAVVYTPAAPQIPPSRSQGLKAVNWNIDRGKNFDSIVHVLRHHPQLSEADLYFLTEVDWGMARSGNRNVAADLGEVLQRYAYFAPSYYNFTKGYQSERHLPGKNKYGLHGKAILSRYPLEDLHVIPIPNTLDVLSSKEARIGEKRALVGDLNWGGRSLRIACLHLEPFSSPQARAQQIQSVLKAFDQADCGLVAGDLNTNTLNTSSWHSLSLSILRQIIFSGPRKMQNFHHLFPEYHYDKPLFETLESRGFDYESFNELGVGTLEFFSNEEGPRRMVSDQFPPWIFKLIQPLAGKGGSLMSLKLDWFAGKKIRGREKKVVKLKPKIDYATQDRPSDHHPVTVTINF